MVPSNLAHPETHQKTCPPMPLEVSLPTSVWLHILEWPSTSTPAPPSPLARKQSWPSKGLAGDRQVHPCLEGNVCRPQPWLRTRSSPGTQFLPLSAIVWIQSCPSRDTCRDLTGATYVCAPGKGQLCEDLTADPAVDPRPWTTLLNQVLEAVPYT